MNHQWYIPEPKYHHDSANANQLIWLLQEKGIEVFCDKYIPFGAMEYPFLDAFRPIIFYGSLSVIKDVNRKRLPFYPFAWCDFDELKCSNYYAWWGKYLVQQRYAIYPLAEISRNREFIYTTFGADDCIFVRPDDNMKTFSGQIVEKEHFEGWWRHTRDDSGPNCPCIVSRPEPISLEWRLVIKDKKVITGSQYMDKGCLSTKEGFPDDVAIKAEEIANSTAWEPHPIYVMDIALTSDEYKLLEIGSVNAAGMYKCDLRKIVNAITKLTNEEYLEPGTKV